MLLLFASVLRSAAMAGIITVRSGRTLVRIQISDGRFFDGIPEKLLPGRICQMIGRNFVQILGIRCLLSAGGFCRHE
jgi:hypothetical protein